MILPPKIKFLKDNNKLKEEKFLDVLVDQTQKIDLNILHIQHF